MNTITIDRAAFDAWCKKDNPKYQPSDDGMSNRRDWKVWQAALAQTAAQPAVPDAFARFRGPITEEMHRAACKVLLRAPGLDGLPQRMLNAMLAAAPQAAERVPMTKEDSQIASDAIDAMLKEYGYPANPKNAARAGWRACRLMVEAAHGITSDKTTAQACSKCKPYKDATGELVLPLCKCKPTAQAEPTLKWCDQCGEGMVDGLPCRAKSKPADCKFAAQAEIAELRLDSECFRLWVHEAWHNPGDICRLLNGCETPDQYRAKLLPIIQARKAAIDAAIAKESSGKGGAG